MHYFCMVYMVLEYALLLYGVYGVRVCTILYISSQPMSALRAYDTYGVQSVMPPLMQTLTSLICILTHKQNKME